MIFQEPFRLDPAMPVHAYTSYQIVAPLKTHWRPATCAEVECERYLKGWQIRKENLDAQNLYLATHTGRAFKEVKIAEGETWLLYPPGQPCFEARNHRLRLEREEFFYRRPGDWRGLPDGGRVYKHARPDFWVEDFAEHQDKLITAIEQG